MGTKNKPGAFDCYANAEPDEPMFILLGRDPLAPETVLDWARRREATRGPTSKVEEARECAKAMMAWADRKDGLPPRRSRIDRFVPAEKAIYDAVGVIETMPPDVRLTRAQIKLQEARALVADFVDGVLSKDPA